MNILDNLVTSVNITVPIVLILAVGYFLGRIGFIKDSFIKTANKLNFRVFLPCSVFASLYCNSVSFDEGMRVLIAEVILIVAIFIAAMFIARASTQNPSQRGTMIAGILRSNYVYIGQPIICAICGITSSPIGAIVLAAIAIVANILTPLGFTLNNGKEFDMKTLIKDTFVSPYIIASIIGIILMLLKCPQFPTFIHKSITSLASICTPLAPIFIRSTTSCPCNTPPAAITGTSTASTICGTSAIVVISPIWPPDSVPS